VPATFVAARAEDVASDLVRDLRPRRIVLNPGRSGARAEVIDVLARSGARIAYLSCNPATLARDLARAVEIGCRVERVVPVDFMPQTDHVEALALLSSIPSSAQ
jgi:23S rRNA (uracil1939-C5)-methyltransferase